VGREGDHPDHLNRLLRGNPWGEPGALEPGYEQQGHGDQRVRPGGAAAGQPDQGGGAVGHGVHQRRGQDDADGAFVQRHRGQQQRDRGGGEDPAVGGAARGQGEGGGQQHRQSDEEQGAVGAPLGHGDGVDDDPEGRDEAGERPVGPGAPRLRLTGHASSQV